MKLLKTSTTKNTLFFVLCCFCFQNSFSSESILDESFNVTKKNSALTKNLEEISEDEVEREIQSLDGPNRKPAANQRKRFIKHPGQKKGLYKIAADGTYYYKVNESKQKYGIAVKGGALNLNQLVNKSTGTSFNDIYGTSTKPSVYLEYYWSFFKDKNVPNLLKKSRIKLGSGILFANGSGQFANKDFAGVETGESYNFLAFPNHLGLHLAFELKDKQIFLPYLTGALEYLVAVEFQADNLKRTKFLGQLGAHVGAGVAISLGWLEETAKFDLDAEFGINQTYFTIEFRRNIAIQTDFNFSANFIIAGLQFEF